MGSPSFDNSSVGLVFAGSGTSSASQDITTHVANTVVIVPVWVSNHGSPIYVATVGTVGATGPSPGLSFQRAGHVYGKILAQYGSGFGSLDPSDTIYNMELWWSPAPTAGTYTVTVSGVNTTTGSFGFWLASVKNVYDINNPFDGSTNIALNYNTSPLQCNYGTNLADDLVFYMAGGDGASGSACGDHLGAPWTGGVGPFGGGSGGSNHDVMCMLEVQTVSTVIGGTTSATIPWGAAAMTWAFTGTNHGGTLESLALSTDGGGIDAQTTFGETETDSMSYSSTTAVSSFHADRTASTDSFAFTDSASCVFRQRPIPFGVTQTGLGLIWHHETPILMGFDASNVLSYFVGPSLAAGIITPELEPELGKRFRINSAKPLVEGNFITTNDVTVNLGSRLRQEDAVVWNGAITVNIWDECPQRVDTRYVRGLITIPAGTAWTHVEGLELKIAESTPR